MSGREEIIDTVLYTRISLISIVSKPDSNIPGCVSNIKVCYGCSINWEGVNPVYDLNSLIKCAWS